MKERDDDIRDQLATYANQVEMLQQELELYKSAAKGANDGLWDWDLINNKPFVSQPWIKMLGIDQVNDEEMQGLWARLLHPKDRKKATEKFDDFIMGKSDDYQQEFRMKHVKGHYIWILSKAKAVRDQHGNAIRVSGSHTDITESKENLIELQKVNFELDSFVYHASHDLRSPLRSILGLIDLYHLDKNPKTQANCIERIEGSVKRLDSLVVELLSISRNDRVDDKLVDINFMVEINNSVSNYYNASNTSDLEIKVKVDQKINFKSDLTRIRIILNNLISNAIKYRAFESNDFIKIEATVNKKEAIFKVIDNGLGIEESKLPHIFDMFYRATEKSEGSGLGLYIVKKVADKLKATIDIESYELEGTTFIVKIPNSIEK